MGQRHRGREQGVERDDLRRDDMQVRRKGRGTTQGETREDTETDDLKRAGGRYGEEEREGGGRRGGEEEGGGRREGTITGSNNGTI